ncbi:MAG: YegS/Rv2252/BmrU family lipid kinase, partial [Clostridiales bacterium]|nr:YegS/Rv2252/BmrU family lipid kinase [Clostridiales bacterium]
MKRVVLIYNPNAGDGSFVADLDQVITEFAENEMLLIPVRIGTPFTLDRIMKDRELKNCHKIIVAGGDGTISWVVNAMVKHDVHIPLAIFPTGTANDLASYLRIPTDLEGMMHVATESRLSKMDVGIAADRCFVNVLAIGMLVDISQRTDPAIKNTLGLGAYYLRGLAEVPFARATPLRLISDERMIESSSSAVIVMNGRQAGGFHNIAPDSEIGDGLLDVVFFHKLILPVMLPVLLSVLAGQHPKDKRVEYFKTAKLRIEPIGDLVVNTDFDGERG